MSNFTAPCFQALPLSAIKPRGWLLAQLQRDLTHGFAGCLDSLTERAASDLFTHRIESSSQQFAWWDSETRGNWLWGYTLLAFLADLPEHRARVAQLLSALKATQDPDGYLGIYSPASRYQHGDDENGELWGQSRALLPLLAYYEFTGDESYLTAVRRAVDLTLKHYGPQRPHFRKPAEPNDLTGLTHGLCYVDVVEWLYALTGEARYRDFGVWLYEDFSRFPAPFPNDDLAPANLLNPQQPWRGHAVHTVEHLRALLFAANDNRPLVEAALRKLRLYTTPSGAVIGDEGVHGLPTPDIGYEYCTLTELLFSLTSAAQKLGEAALGDWIETLAFNAAQGARLPDGRGVSYLTPDTRLAATADRPDSYSHLHDKHGRFKFSPTHEDVACCCNPNATRLLPHYVSRMWLKANDHDLVALLYGACELTTTIRGVRLTVVEETRYPFEDTVRFTLLPDRPVAFALYLRRPGWATRVEVQGAAAREASGYLVVEKTWQAGDTLTLTFTTPITLSPYPTGEYAVRRGSLQFVLPVAHTPRAIKSYPLAGFQDEELLPRDLAQAYALVLLDEALPDFGLTLEHEAGAANPWAQPPLRLRTDTHTLIPFGCALLRRAALPLKTARPLTGASA